MPAVSISTDALDYFNEILTILCRDTLAVTLVPQEGEPFGAVLTGCVGETVVYEAWDEIAGLSNGEPMTITVAEIAEVRVH